MSNELNKEEVTPVVEDATPLTARLQDGEPLLPAYLNTEDTVKAVHDIVSKYKEMVDQESDEDVADIIEEITEEPVVEQKAAKPETKTTKPKSSKKKEEDKIVAVFSTKNVTWNGVGKVYRGYNIVTQEEADLWATRSHIRVATPEEVAKEFGL